MEGTSSDLTAADSNLPDQKDLCHKTPFSTKKVTTLTGRRTDSKPALDGS
jgi:hypothetical protein